PSRRGESAALHRRATHPVARRRRAPPHPRNSRDAAITAGNFTAQGCRDQPNAEGRRGVIQRYNQGDTGRYLRDIGATVIHEDTDALGLPRRLLRIEQEGDEPFVAIEVTNSTPEPDGTRKKYTFRCHPELRPLPVPGIRTE